MRQRQKQNTQSSKSSFLQKFAGKLNILTKDGQIREQNSFKLPVINSPQSKRANTIKFSASKQSSHSFFSDVRTEVSLSMIKNSRNGKFFKSKIDRRLTDISNHISKHPSMYGLKKTGKKLFEKEPPTGILFVKKERAELAEQHWKEPQSMELQEIKNHNIQNYEYERFLSELNSVGNSVKIKKGQKQFELNERKSDKSWEPVNENLYYESN